MASEELAIPDRRSLKWWLEFLAALATVVAIALRLIGAI